MKTAPAQVTLGQNITYSITAANTGIVPATSVTIDDTLPAGATFVSATPTVGSCDAPASGHLVCHLGTLAVGASVSVTVTPTAVGTETNTVVVTPEDNTPSDNTSTVQTVVVAAAVTPAVVPAAAVVIAPSFTG